MLPKVKPETILALLHDLESLSRSEMYKLLSSNVREDNLDVLIFVLKYLITLIFNLFKKFNIFNDFLIFF